MKFIKCKDINELSLLAANNFKEVLTQKANPVLGMATGSSPIQTYQNLIKMHNNKEISFKNTKTFNLDEYVGLQPKYVFNSYKDFMDKNLFDFVDINKNNIHFPISWNQEVDINKTDYSLYDEQINKESGLDLLILGLGNNGHIGFNEPGSLLNSKTRLVPLTKNTITANSRFFDSIDDVPRYAVSMGIDTILKAKKIILIVVGDSKKEALNVLKQATAFDINWPCTALVNHKDVTVYFIDDNK